MGSMTSAEFILESLSEIDRVVRLMALAADEREVLRVVRAYLGSWPRERVTRLQAVDAGWAPFDGEQEPATMLEPGDVLSAYQAVRDQIHAIKEAGMDPTPELLELDLVLFFASESLAVHRPGELRPSGHGARPAGGSLRLPARTATLGATP